MSDEVTAEPSASELLAAEKPTKERFAELIPGKWSSHPVALKRQRIWFFAIGLVPLVALAIIGFIALSDFHAWIDLILHPGRAVVVVAVAVSLGVGVVGTVSLINLMGRAGVGNKDLGQGNLEVSRTIVVVSSLLWLLPLAATFLPSVHGRGSLIFLLNLLCFVPLGAILLLVLFGGNKKLRPEMTLKRRPVWLVLGSFLAALCVLSLLTDVHALLRRVDWLKSVPLVQAGTLRIILLATLFPLATVCFSVWEIFKKAVPCEEGASSTGAEESVRKKPWYRRMWDYFFGQKKDVAEETSVHPRWADDLRKYMAEGFAGVKVGEIEQLVGKDVASIDETNVELSLLMGGIKPTVDQSKFYRQLKDAYCGRVAGAKRYTEHGVESVHCASPDIVLQGDIGSGRTESLMAAALYGAIVRGQNVILVTNCQRLTESIVKRINVRLESLMLQNYVQCFQLTNAPWALDETQRGLPCIYVGTPGAIEQHLFDSPGRIHDTVSARQRLFIQETDLLLFDDMTEMDVEVRSHLVFIVDKLRLLYASEDIVPQFVFVTRKLHRIGTAKFIKRLFDGVEDDFDSNNLVVLRNRAADKGWKLSIHTNFSASPEDVCKSIVKWCVLNRVNVLLYRKGVGNGFCAAYKDRIKKELLGDKDNPPPQDVVETISDRLAVVSSLDGSDDELERSQAAGIGAVLYFPELAGESGMAIRLNLAGGEPLFIRILECPDSVEEVLPGGIPLLPNTTAVPLRNAHLKSVIRFIPQGTPIKAVVWNNLGVDAGSARVGGIHTRETETWIFDQWRDEQDAFMIQERDSTMSDTIDLTTLPEMDGYDVIRTDDGRRLVLGKVENDDSVKRLSHLFWIKDEKKTETYIKGLSTDLAHANVITSSYDGETYTIDRLVRVDRAGKNEYRILAKTWNGDGNDRELPIKTFSWEVESVCAPTAVVLHDHLIEFKLPLMLNRYRSTSVSVAGFSNFNGRETGLDEFKFEYSVRYAGFALCPAGVSPSVVGAYTQSTLVGKWSTTPDCGFSPVATHLIMAAFKRLLPDLPFFATCPIFFVKDRPDAVAQAIMWVIEPINSGETAYPVLKDVFLGALDRDGGDVIPSVVQMVRTMAKSLQGIHDKTSFVAYLRLLSGVAFNVEHFSEESLEADLSNTLALLDAFEERIKGTAAVPPIVHPLIPPSLRTTWMTAPRPKSDLAGLHAGDWLETPVLSYKAPLNLSEDNSEGSVVCTWKFEDHKFELHVGFPREAENQAYVNSFMGWRRRPVGGNQTDGRVYAEYGVNDPYREYVKAVASKLKSIFDEWVAPSDDNQRRLAEFMLYFVQSGMDYRHDPKCKDPYDWPRFPSETLANGAGDCEDTSILYMELLRHVGIDSALFSVPEHACVGVAVPISRTLEGEEPVVYGWAGKQYAYAETAMDKGRQRVLGADCKNEDGTSVVSASSIQHVVPTPMETGMNSIRILNVTSTRSSATVTVMTKIPEEVGETIAVVCYARFSKHVFDEPLNESSARIGGLILSKPEASVARTCVIPLDASGAQGKGSWWLDVFACDPQTGHTLGHFVGGELLS